MPKHCIVLLSGGLDSLLVTRLMAAQGLRVTAMHTLNCFHSTQALAERQERLRADALRLGAEDIVFPDITDDIIALVRRPKHGYGRNLNPCIDCRLRTMREGFGLMAARGADFVVTGEVAGQRPMSQRRDALSLADREIARWGHAGLLLRPLSAKLLPETTPQRERWVDPGRLYDISGRGRDRQMAMAEELGIGAYPSPAGGCLLTDPGFSERLRRLMRCRPDWGADDVELLKVGRHFCIGAGVKVVASRREEENYLLRGLARPGDRFYINDERNGAIVLLRGGRTEEAERIAAGLAVHFSKMRDDGSARVKAWDDDGEETLAAAAVNPDEARDMERLFMEKAENPAHGEGE